MALVVKGGNSMPRLDGTGPDGQGPMTGRGTGNCSASKAAGRQYYGRNFFARGARGYRNRFFVTETPYFLTGTKQNNSALLKERAEMLKEELEKINDLINKEEQK